MPDAKEKKLRGFGLTREQIIGFLKKRDEDSDTRPTVIKELYDSDDLSLVTETHGRMVVPKVRMRIIMAAADTTREKSLIQVFLEEYNKEMVSFERKGRLELLGALQALALAGEEERPVSLGR